jgi:tetratricopeptide (TPR) repeat protein
MVAAGSKCGALFVFLTMYTAVLPAQSDNSERLKALFQRGAEAMQQGDLATAETSFQQATQLAPDFAPAFLDLGLTELREGKLLEATASIRKSLELDPNSPSSHLFLGIAEYQSSHPDEAASNLQQAIEEDPNNVQALTWLGIVELNTGHPEKAVDPFDRASKLSPKDEAILDYCVQAHMAVAKQNYSQLYKLDPTSWRLHRLNAVIDSQALEHKQAIEEYQLAINLAPNQPDLYEGLGWEYRALDQNDQAVATFKKELALTPGNPTAMYNLASAEVENGQAQEAIPILEKVVKVYNVPTQADYYLGRALATEGHYDEAAREFQRATALTDEMQRRSYYELAQTYRHMGKTAEAHEAIATYQKLRQEADRQSAQQVEDWRKLNAANAAAETGTDPK